MESFFQPAQAGELFAAILLLLLGLAFFFIAKRQADQPPKRETGFLSIMPSKPCKFFPLHSDILNMEPVVESLADSGTNVYSNLSKITLSIKPGGVYLEEKNYKISILVNRRRCRRCYLNDGDIIDMGELTIMFQSPETEKSKAQESQGAPEPKQGFVRVKRNTGKLLKVYPTLVPIDTRKKTVYLSKNITYVGRSQMNDLVPKAKAVNLRHSKIERISGRYKISDLETTSGTFVNGRRVETKYLKDGDMISFESIKYTFSMNLKTR